MPLFAKKKEEVKKLVPKVEAKPVSPIMEVTDDEDYEDDEDDSYDADVFDTKEESDNFSKGVLNKVDSDNDIPIPTYGSIEEIKLTLKKLIRRKCEIDGQLKSKRIIEKSDQTQMGLKTETMMMNEGDEIQLLIQNLETQMIDAKVPDKEIEEIEKEALGGVKAYRFIQ